MYVDGVLQASTNPNTLVISPGGLRDFAIGANLAPESPVLFFDGLIDEFEFFDRALSSLEIQAIFDAGSAGKCKTPQDQINGLIQQVEALVTAGTLNNGQGNALISKLVGAIAKIEQGNLNAAVNKLQAFINQVQGFINAGTLTPEQGQALIDAAEAVIVVLEAQPRIAEAGLETFEYAQALLEAVPEQYALVPNYPNPFNPSTEIRFDLPEAEHVRLVVYNARGQEVARLVDQPMSAGTHSVTWDAKGLPSGTYLYRLTAGPFSQTKAMALLK